MSKRLKTKLHTTHIQEPPNGWVEHGVYVVEVAHHPANPIHIAIFYVGYLHEGKPGNYNALWNPTWDSSVPIEDIYYLKPINFLGPMFEIRSGNVNKLFSDCNKQLLPPGEYTCKVDEIKLNPDGTSTIKVIYN